MEIDPITEKKINKWLHGPYDAETKATIQKLKKDDPQELIDAFHSSLTFGTAGMRGIMGVGTNRLNKYTIRSAAQGLANYINQQEGEHRVVIGYDSRFHSREFAEETARVLAGSGIDAYLTNELRPTPFISFACRYLKCTSAVMITASHNPSAYNGFKVYWSDGAQVVSPEDRGIVNEVHKIVDPTQVELCDLDHPKIHILGPDLDEVYLQTLATYQNRPNENQAHGKELQLVFSNLHGTGITLLPQALERWGFSSLAIVEEQREPDGNFPSAQSPNPEQKEALYLGIKDLEKTHGDLLLITDPDADRIGVVARHKGKSVILSGNQIAAICFYYLCQRPKRVERGAFVTTIVSSPLLEKIATSFDYACIHVLTGFKFIGEKIKEWDCSHQYQFIFGAEESHGYLFGTYARDKDALMASCLLSEIALMLKLDGKTLIDYLFEIYQKFGIYREKQLSVSFEATIENMAKMDSLTQTLREHPPTEIANQHVTVVEDYKKQQINGLPKANVLSFTLADESKLIVRPSGTEPKIKIYGMAYEKEFSSIDEGLKKCDEKLNHYLNALKNHLK